MTEKYDLEKINNEIDIEISEIKKEFPNVEVTINGYKVLFKNHSDYYMFGYLLKRQKDLGISSRTLFRENVSKDDEFLIMSSSFNLLFSCKRDAKNEGILTSELNILTHFSDKCFWGHELGDGRHLTISVDGTSDTKVRDYLPHSTDQYNTKVLIQPGDTEYDESFFVYVKPDPHRPNCSTEVFHVLSKINDKYIYEKAHYNAWVY